MGYKESMISFDEKNSRSEKLLQAAAHLFARWGFDKTTVEEIAREADVSKGAVYLEFKGKDELFRAVVYRELVRYTEDWLRRFEADREAWNFAGMFRHSIAAIHANPFIKGLVTRDRRIYGDFLKRDTTLVSMVMSMRKDFFGMLQSSGAVRDDIPPATLAYLLTSMAFGIVAGGDIIPEEDNVPFDDALRGLALLLDRGLAPVGATGNEESARLFFGRMVGMIRTLLEELGLPDKEKEEEK